MQQRARKQLFMFPMYALPFSKQNLTVSACLDPLVFNFIRPINPR